jgi:hypothetical protein
MSTNCCGDVTVEKDKKNYDVQSNVSGAGAGVVGAFGFGCFHPAHAQNQSAASGSHARHGRPGLPCAPSWYAAL